MKKIIGLVLCLLMLATITTAGYNKQDRSVTSTWKGSCESWWDYAVGRGYIDSDETFSLGYQYVDIDVWNMDLGQHLVKLQEKKNKCKITIELG